MKRNGKLINNDMEKKPNVQKRHYERPAMRVYVLKQRTGLLQGSPRGPYDPIDRNPFGG